MQTTPALHVSMNVSGRPRISRIFGAMRQATKLGVIALGILAAASASAGGISGVVRDANSGIPLPGTLVRVEGTNLSASADADGRFRFPELPAGPCTLKAEVMDEVTTQLVDVPATGTIAQDIFVKSDVVNMDKMVVEGYKEGRSLALQQKRGATNIMDVVSADAVGNLPDRNAAEALSRVAGVNITMSEGEGQYVSIRGLEPNLNQVMVDGATMAAPGGTRTGRAVPLDVLSASQIAQMQIIKSVTPDLDANSLGGTINIKTTSAFDRSDDFLNGGAKLEYNDLREKFGYGGNLLYGKTFGARKFGMAVAASYDKRYTQNDYEQSNGRKAISNNGFQTWLPTGYELYSRPGEKETYGMTLNLEAQLDPTTFIYLRPNYTHASRYQEEKALLYSVGDEKRVNLTSATTGATTGRGRVEHRIKEYEQKEDLFNISGGAKKSFGQLTLEPMLTYSFSKEKRPDEKELRFRSTRDTPEPYVFDFTSFDDWTWDMAAKANDPANYPLRQAIRNKKDLKENIYTAKLDARWDSDKLLFGVPGYIKAGGKYIYRDRKQEIPSYRVIPVTETWTLKDIGVDPGYSIMDGLYNSGFSMNSARTWDYLDSHPSLIKADVMESLSNTIQDDYKIEEKIYAAYVMASLKPTSKLTILGGVRWERTDDEISAYELRYNDVAGAFGQYPISGSTTYDNVLPNIQLTYTPIKQLVLRAAFTMTIGRPAYEDARPVSYFTYHAVDPSSINYDPDFPDTGTLKVGNPELKPWQSMNFDLSAEYYTKLNGVLSLAFFNKNIKDPIFEYRRTLLDTEYEGLKLYQLDVSSFMNADSGRISGLEATLYQPLQFLPSPLDGLGIDANMTFVDSEVTIPHREPYGEDFGFFRQPDKIANVSLFYEKYGFYVRFAFHYEGQQLWTVGENTLKNVGTVALTPIKDLEDRYRKPYYQYDFQIRYRFTKNLAATFAIKNLTNKREQFTYGKDTNFMRTSQIFGRNFVLSMNCNF